MDIEESSGPYRGFRSGSYPAITKRIVDSGGVLLRASSWFALIVTAASAGYNMTQRLVSESAVSPQLALKAPTLPRIASTAPSSAPKPPAEHVAPVEPRAAPVEEQASATATGQGASAPTMPARTGSVAIATPAIKDNARIVLAPHKHNQAAAHGQLLTAATPDVEASASEDASRRSAERVRELESDPHRTVKELPRQTITEEASAAKSGAAIEITVEAESRPTASTTSTSTAPKPVAPALPSVVHVTPAARVQPSVQLPLAATTRIDGLTVNGSMTSANVRHGLERVQPMFAECYSQAAQRAGQNRFSPVRVVLSIDEAGRVKTQPSVEGAELPGLAACLSSAFSKLVCRAPDTGTAKASMTLRFSAIASANRAETR